MGRNQRLGQVAIDGRLHQLVARHGGVVMRHRRTALERVGRKHQRPAQGVGTRELRACEPDGPQHTGARARNAVQAGANRVAVVQRHAHGADHHRRVAAPQPGRCAGHVVVDDHANGTRVLRIFRLHGKAAAAAVDDGDSAVDGRGLVGREGAAGQRTGAVGFQHRHHLRGERRRRQRSAERRLASTVGSRCSTRSRTADRHRRQALTQHAGNGRRHTRSGPDQTVNADRRCHALGRRHLRPCQACGGAQQVVVPDRREAAVESTRRSTREGLKTDAMAHLVLQHGDKVDIGAVVAVQAVVPKGAGQTVGRAQVDVEVGIDLRGVCCAQIQPGQLVGQCIRIPGGSPGRIRKVAEDGRGAGAAQNRRGGGAGQRRELRIDDDWLVAGQRRAPQVGRVGEGDQALLAQRGTGVSADGRCGCGVVEAHAGCVDVVDDDGGRSLRLLGGAGQQTHDGSDAGQRLDAEKCTAHFSCSLLALLTEPGVGRLANCGAFMALPAASLPCTQTISTVPSALRRATE